MNDMDIYENIRRYNLKTEGKILIVFDDMITDMLSNKKASTNSNEIIYQSQKTKQDTENRNRKQKTRETGQWNKKIIQIFIMRETTALDFLKIVLQ